MVSMISPGKIFGLTVGHLRNASSTHHSGRIISFGSTINLVLHSWQPKTTDLSLYLRDLGIIVLIPMSFFSL